MAGAVDYLVVLRPAPLATYDGGVPGLAATAPSRGHRFDATRPAVAAYEQHLLTGQRRVLSQLDDPPLLYSYTTALNGFAATLTSDQVNQLRSLPDVLMIQPSRTERLTGSASSSDGLGGTGDGGPWQSVGGHEHSGKHVVIGVVDSGIWPENPSFAGVPIDPARMQSTYPGFTGSCQQGERWSASTCNAKVIAARSFLNGFGATSVAASEYASPRDGSGHGSHTAAIAAGNAGVDVAIGHQHFGRVSGVAPASALAVYKACWTAPDPADDGCATPDTAKAIDQAVRDGVDILNYSITGGDQDVLDVVELAFLNAASAGVFVATAAGDAGPGAATVSHPSPWVTTVAASQADSYRGTVLLGDGRHFGGAMVSDVRVRDSRLVYAGDAPSESAPRHQASLCFPGSLDAGAVAGAVVVCDRGATARLSKSLTVSQAGGAAMVLANLHPGSIDADLHEVPSMQVGNRAGAAIKSYLHSSARPTASLRPDPPDKDAPPVVADFSSRGPAPTTGGDVLKPDLTAPGVGILAAAAPASNFGHLWDISSGTSMAAPEVAGLAAILASARPRWTPAIIKSALMTTATEIGDHRLPLEQGAGEVDPRRFLDPGLGYPAGRSDWLGYLSGITPRDGLQVAAQRTDAVDLNAASIAVGSLVGQERVSRRVTNTARSPETYTAKVAGLRGIATSVSRPSLTLLPGQSATFDVTFSAEETARYERFAYGTLTWRGSLGHVVRSPVVVRPELLEAPEDLSASGANGVLQVSARAGVTGTIAATSSGLVSADPIGFALEAGDFDPTDPSTSASTFLHTFSVRKGATLARFEAASPGTGPDLDLFAYRHGDLVASAASRHDLERVTLADPAPGDYDVYVHAASDGVGGSSTANLTGWVLPGDAADVSRLDVSPSPTTVTGGRTFALRLSWQNLDPSKRWFAAVDYEGSSRHTFVTIS